MQEPYKLSLSCKSTARHIWFAWILQDIYCLQKPFKTSIICKNLSRNIISAGILQDLYYLQEHCKITPVCKNISRFLSYAKNHLEISIFWRYRARCLLLAKKSKENVILMHKFCKIFVISKKLAVYLMIGGLFQDI